VIGFVIVGVLLFLGAAYYLSRRSNQNAIDRLRAVSPDEAAKLDLVRAEHAARSQLAQGGGGFGSTF
jgi:hypothetical protein